MTDYLGRGGLSNHEPQRVNTPDNSSGKNDVAILGDGLGSYLRQRVGASSELFAATHQPYDVKANLWAKVVVAAVAEYPPHVEFEPAPVSDTSGRLTEVSFGHPASHGLSLAVAKQRNDVGISVLYTRRTNPIFFRAPYEKDRASKNARVPPSAGVILDDIAGTVTGKMGKPTSGAGELGHLIVGIGKELDTLLHERGDKMPLTARLITDNDVSMALHGLISNLERYSGLEPLKKLGSRLSFVAANGGVFPRNKKGNVTPDPKAQVIAVAMLLADMGDTDGRVLMVQAWKTYQQLQQAMIGTAETSPVRPTTALNNDVPKLTNKPTGPVG